MSHCRDNTRRGNETIRDNERYICIFHAAREGVSVDIITVRVFGFSASRRNVIAVVSSAVLEFFFFLLCARVSMGV